MSGFPEEFSGRVAVRTVPHQDDEARHVVKAQGWRTHGLTLTQEGRVVYAAGDHHANAVEANLAIRRQLGLDPVCEERP